MTAPSTDTTGPADHAEHPPWLAHHFDTPDQQFSSAKLGMWVFVLTEILFFSGLFCVYAVYRRNHPELFVDGHYFLNTALGAVNTAVLLFSSFTMAWGVRCIQLGKIRGLVTCLLVTLACAIVFLGIKYAEYRVKWEHHMVPGQARIAAALGWESPVLAELAPGEPAPRGFFPDRAYMAEKLRQADKAAGVRILSESLYQTLLQERIQRLSTFFGIYFCLTGLHGLHVLAGMVVLSCVLVGAVQGRYHAGYYTPVDLGGLYWHLVDLIWIFLFPLLYLIH